jgi:hypothetical protein
VDAKAKGLADLKARLAGLGASPPDDGRVQETEALLISYLDHHQLALARLAYESLLDLAPLHPRRGDYEGRLNALANESERDHRADKAISAAREALARGDLSSAERGLTAVRRAAPSPEKAAALEAELEQARREQEQAALLARHRTELERRLEQGDLARAEAELSHLIDLGAPKVTLDLLRQSLAQARRLAAVSEPVRDLETRFAQHLAKGDWFAAREVALEMERVAENHPQLPSMYQQVDALRQREERKRAIEQGERQVETLVAAGRASEAAFALKVLLKMDPENAHRRQLERKIAALG